MKEMREKEIEKKTIKYNNDNNNVLEVDGMDNKQSERKKLTIDWNAEKKKEKKWRNRYIHTERERQRM